MTIQTELFQGACPHADEATGQRTHRFKDGFCIFCGNKRWPEDGKLLRDEGIKQVSDHNKSWMQRCIEFATERAARAKRDFTGEDIRFACELHIGSPKHPNAWGALVNTLVKRNIIVPTGEHRHMKDKTSHARSNPVYRKP